MQRQIFVRLPWSLESCSNFQLSLHRADHDQCFLYTKDGLNLPSCQEKKLLASPVSRQKTRLVLKMPFLFLWSRECLHALSAKPQRCLKKICK